MLRPILIILPLVLLFSFCRKENENEPAPPDSQFDKQGLLINLADQVIQPAYKSYQVDVDSLLKCWQRFTMQPEALTLQTLRLQFNSAYSAYQFCDLFEFGPAESLFFRSSCNVFPADTTQILNNIASGSYNLQALSNISARGWPALDYLFYRPGYADSSLVQLLATSAQHRKYVQDLLQDLSSRINSIVSGWASIYRSTFIASLGTDVGSSIGYVINQLNFQLDYLKNAKLGIPLGKKSLGIIQPRQCEAYYSGESLLYCINTLDAIENLYLGRNASGANGTGFDDYIEHLKITRNGGSLNVAIQEQFKVAHQKLQALQGPISQEVQVNYAATDAAYVELVKLLVLLKTDMPSGLGVVITYQDGDGD